MKKLAQYFLSFVISIGIIGYFVLPQLKDLQVVFAQEKFFTPQELATFDGKDGHKAYYAYEGKVYDVTGSKLWEEGEHFGLHAGQDLTGKMEGAPHGTEVFTGFEVVGTYGVAASSVESPAPSPTSQNQQTLEQQNNSSAEQPEQWYEKRIRLWGISILGWTGILLAIFFVFTFGTCFALPWAKLRLPWVGNRPGPDPLDASGAHLTWSSVHKYFVWFTVVLGIVHGLIGFLQFFGIYL